MNHKMLSERESFNVFLLLFSNIVDQVRIFNNNLIMNCSEFYHGSFVERQIGNI